MNTTKAGLMYRLSTAILLTIFALGAQAQNKCSAVARMGNEKFASNNCAVALFDKQHSVSIWFNENPISVREAKDFEKTGDLGLRWKSGQQLQQEEQRSFVLIEFCPGGGATTASAATVRSMLLITNDAKSPHVGIWWTVRSPKDFKVFGMSGEIKPGGTLDGKVVGSWHKTKFNLEFDVKLPAYAAEDPYSPVSCGQ